MIKKLRVTVDGKSYDVTVEIPDEAGSPSPAPPPPVIAPSAPPPPSAPPAPAAKAGGGPGAVTSPLAGRVIAILVTPGQTVKAGEQLLTIEAMKMNTAVNAPRDGKVSEILTTVGVAVDEGQVLVRLDEAK
jgi:biotin carboxyl carrier protein